MRRRRDDVRVGDGVVVAGMHLAGDQPREVRHVDHERGTDLIGDLPQDPEVHEPRVGAVTGDQDQRPFLVGPPPDLVVVEEKRLRIDAVGAVAEQLPGDVRAEAVGQVPTRLQRHTEQRLADELLAQRLPVIVGEIIHVAGREALQRR